MRRPFVVFLFLAGLATAIYSNTFSSPFQFDDQGHIMNYDPIKRLSNFADLSGSRYVGFLSFALNYRVGGSNVVGYHAVNLGIHIANGFLVYTLVGLLLRTPGGRLVGRPDPTAADRLAPAQGVAWATALLFIVHPIQTQAVTYIVQRLTSLATLFYLLAVVCYIHWRLSTPGPRAWSGWWYAGALGATILAMKTKEISFTLPFMLLLVEGVCFQRATWKEWTRLVPFLLTLPLIPLSLSGTMGQPTAGFARETTDISRLSYLFTQFRVIVTYLRLLILPIHQNVDYDYSLSTSLLEPSVLGAFLLLLSLSGGALLLLVAPSRFRLAGLGLLWFFLTLSVESSIIPIRDVIFEHRVYLPSVGFLLAASVAVFSLSLRLGRIPVIVVGVAVCMAAVATYHRNRAWHDEIALWTSVVAESPKKARPHNYLGNAYLQQGRLDQAAQEYRLAIHLTPTYPEIHNNLGYVYARQGRLEEAIEEYTTALRLDPGFPRAHFHLGNAYLQQGRLEDAITEYTTALDRKFDYPDIHNNLGTAYLQQRRFDEAIKEFLTAIQLDPDFTKAHNNLGNAYAQQGRLDQAAQEYRLAIHLTPTYPEIHHNLGYTYARLGRLEEAIEEYTTALRLDPGFPRAHFHLGNAYLQQGRLEDAITEYTTAVQLGESLPELFYNLGNAYGLKGLHDEARKQYETALHLWPNYLPAKQALRSLKSRS